jgi:hypothetical protein
VQVFYNLNSCVIHPRYFIITVGYYTL